MYTLCKVEKVNGAEMFAPLKSRLSLEELTDEVKKRVRDGCAVHRLRIFKDVEFEVVCGVKYND